MALWRLTDEMSLDKEASKRVMIYYAAPSPEKYGYYSSTSKSARDSWLKEIGAEIADGKTR